MTAVPMPFSITATKDSSSPRATEPTAVADCSGLTVLHSLENWLPLTETWLYNQICYLPLSICSHAVSERRENLEHFPFEKLHTIYQGRGFKLKWEGWLRKLGLRNYSGFKLQVARSIGAQIVHSHFGDIAWQDIGIAKHGGLKHVATFYGHDVNRLPRTDPRWHHRYAELFASVDRVFCEGPYMASSIVRLGCPEDKVQVHHLGVAVDQIAYHPRNRTPGEPLRILIAGTFREKKGIPDALRAVGELNRAVQVEATVIGGTTGESRSLVEEERIRKIIADYNLSTRVRFLGFQSHAVLFAEAYKHHIFLSPSVTAEDGDTEGGAPVSIIEMSATGMPVVATTHCDIPNVVLNGVSGLLAEEHDVTALAGHLQYLAEHPDRWGPMGNAGREHIEAEFNATTQGMRLAAMYGELDTASA